MKISISTTILSLVTIILLISSCTRSIPSTSRTPGINIAQTSAAQTIAAQLTGITDEVFPSETGTISGTVETEIVSTITAQSVNSTDTNIMTPEVDEIQETEITATPEPSPISDVTDSPDDPASNLGEATWVDNFESGENWPLYSNEHVDIDFDENKLVMTAFRPEIWESWTISDPVVKDFYLEVTASPNKCS